MPGDWPRAPFDRIPGYYRELVDKYGHDSRACDYGDAGSQRIKFALLAQAVGADCRSVLDVGCGFGDYLAYLVRRNFGGEYVGIDISDAMVERARKLHPHSEILHGNFLFAEFSRSFDVVTANGIFYLLGTQAESLLQAIVRKMYALCNKTVAFNSLSAWAQDKQDGEYYADPLRSLEFCRSLSPWVSLRHDYHPRDFTIYLHKQKQT